MAGRVRRMLELTAGQPLPDCDPSPKMRGVIRKSRALNSVRDRETGPLEDRAQKCLGVAQPGRASDSGPEGSNPVAPTTPTGLFRTQRPILFLPLLMLARRGA